MKNNPIMFVAALVFFIFVVGMFIYNNFYPKTSAPSEESAKFNHPQTDPLPGGVSDFRDSKLSTASTGSNQLAFSPSGGPSDSRDPKDNAPSGQYSQFRYAGPPAFSVTIPNDFQKEYPKIEEGQILTGKTATGVNVTISAYPAPKESTIEDNGPRTFRPRLAEARNLRLEDVKIFKNEKVALDGGTTAWKCIMKWPFRSITFTTHLITADKDGKRIMIAVHSWKDAAEGLAILESLTFR